jgi:hypothetical protein
MIIPRKLNKFSKFILISFSLWGISSLSWIKYTTLQYIIPPIRPTHIIINAITTKLTPLSKAIYPQIRQFINCIIVRSWILFTLKHIRELLAKTTPN